SPDIAIQLHGRIRREQISHLVVEEAVLVISKRELQPLDRFDALLPLDPLLQRNGSRRDTVNARRTWGSCGTRRPHTYNDSENAAGRAARVKATHQSSPWHAQIMS